MSTEPRSVNKEEGELMNWQNEFEGLNREYDEFQRDILSYLRWRRSY